MGHRIEGIGLLVIAAALVVALWVVPGSPATAITVCPPVTLDDLVAKSKPPSTTTPTPSTTTPTTVTPPTTTAGTTPTTATTPTTTVTTPTTTGPPPPPTCDVAFVYRMVFPIMGGGGIGSPFGAARDGGLRMHAGNDLFAPPMQPIVAAADGTISRIGADEGISGNRLVIRHDDGWSSYYIHLNNDTYGTDDGNGVGVRGDLQVGDRVTAGQVIGWNGDSGNAEGTEKHLHFELHNPAGVAVDPGPSLRSATPAAPSPGADVTTFEGPFADHIWEGEGTDPFRLLLSRGAPMWCDGVGATACPDEPATPADVSAWFDVLIGPVSVDGVESDGIGTEPRVSDCRWSPTCLPPSRSEDASCVAPECDLAGVTELELAQAIVWDRLRDAYELRGFEIQPDVPDAAWSTPVLPPPTHIGEVSPQETEALIASASTCARPTDQDQKLSRIEAAARIAELLGLGPAQCDVPVPARSNPKR